MTPSRAGSAARAVAETRAARSETKASKHRPQQAAAAESLLLPGALLFASGLCALTYQTTWLRELRLVFGASTAATAAALAIFMGGIGLGSAWLGPLADRHPRPLHWYGVLEMGIAVSAAISPIALQVVRGIYLLSGGSAAHGMLVSTLLRLGLATVAIGVPAVLMGGTLPAVARAVENDAQAGRRRLALLLAANTLGAVAGTLLTTFFTLERLGARGTLWSAAGANLVLAAVAMAIGSRRPARTPDLTLSSAASRTEPPHLDESQPHPAPRSFVLLAAACTGFVFFVMELVWYRMLGPILGGTIFTFGLVLAVALLGLCLGNLLYAVTRSDRSPTLPGFALTCALEALALALPFALGDRLAMLAMVLRSFSGSSFLGLLGGWSLVCGIVVFPGALAAGFQFPLLLGLLGRGARRVGHDTGAAYGWNTLGAMAGSLAAGFALLPWLTAPGLWRLSAIGLAVLGLGALAIGRRAARAPRAVTVAVVTLAAMALVIVPMGPTAAWRHTGIGAGRQHFARIPGWNEIARLIRDYRGTIRWQADGRESAVAISSDAGYSLIVNGKSDGNIIDDAGTQIMSGLLGAFLHPNPRRALVIGLGTGSTAGWLARVPSIERVDAVELEPAVMEMVRRCAPANGDPIANPKVHIRFGDGREFLLAGQGRYDLISSEPSNPYRAGVASLYSLEFYQAAAARLEPGGLFLQWMQAYEIDLDALRTVYATLGAVFPHIETWATMNGDLLLVAGDRPLSVDLSQLRRKLGTEPFRSAVAAAWRVRDLEGVYAHYIGNDHFSAALPHGAPRNTDDRMVLEYAFARSVGASHGVDLNGLRKVALLNQQAVPYGYGDTLSFERLIRQRNSAPVVEGLPTILPPRGSPYEREARMMLSYLANHEDEAGRYLPPVAADTTDLTQLAIVAAILASHGDPAALGPIATLGRVRPAEAQFLLTRYHLERHELVPAANAYVSACEAFRTDSWTWSVIAARNIPLGQDIARLGGNGPLTRRVYEALGQPFAGEALSFERKMVRVSVAEHLDGLNPGKWTREALAAFDDRQFPWDQSLLQVRAACYRTLNDPRAGRARAELERFAEHEEDGGSYTSNSP